MSIKTKQKGISLIEVLIAVTILSFIGIGLVSLQYILTQNQILVTRSYKSVDEANLIISTFIKEIRAAKTSDNGAYSLFNVDDQSIGFYSDIDLDGSTEKVRYFLNEHNLYKGVIEPSGYPAQYNQDTETVITLNENIYNETPVFYYYNADWPEDIINNPLGMTNRLADTRSVKIYLLVKNGDTANGYEVESISNIRMLKDNL
ncbi:MAG TPA: prepilin-type N-terminal cleavage/methylation domain-containing protein [Patescibacteria group bacterium]|nr:prepilin-type N-terminal cleavage/methylation domain-containing protein [Patescibacteria group bacterium]